MRRSLIRILKKRGAIKLIKPSLEVSKSYLIKSENCFLSGKILFEKKLYENSISMFYYAMYESLISLLFRVGIKSENHYFSIFLLEKLFNRKDLFDLISFARKERIDKQYYVAIDKFSIKGDCKKLLLKTENFLLEIKQIIENLKIEEIVRIKEAFFGLIK